MVTPPPTPPIHTQVRGSPAVRGRASRMTACSLFENANVGVGVTAVQYQWLAGGRVSQAFLFPRKGLVVSQAVPGSQYSRKRGGASPLRRGRERQTNT